MYRSFFEKSHRCYVDNLLNISCSTNLTEEQVNQVVEKLKEFKK